MNTMQAPPSPARPLFDGGAARAHLAGDIRPELLRDETLADLFRASAAGFPEKTLYRSGERQLGYGEADQLTERAARRLAALGAKPGMVIGLWMPRGIDLLLAQVAITKTGAAFLPFDADAPAPRIATCLADAQGLLLVSDAAGIMKAQGLALPVQDIAPLLADAAMPEAVLQAAQPDDAAYLIYTSGSTGIPKGIEISQRNICHFLRAGNAVYGIHGDDIVFQGASVAFDLSMEEIWVPYLVGATLYVATPDILMDIEKLPALLSAEGVTVIDTVPTLLSVLHGDIPSLRLILLGGEALPPALAERWLKPGRRMVNTYGPTEATVVATIDEVFAGKPVTIGRPIPNYTCYVVDDTMSLLGTGQEGELLIGGPGVAKGYLKRAELTAEKFIPNPFHDQDRVPRLYRSGDAVSLTAEGTLAFHGRIDDQVKIRGFRVELGEIENALTDCADVLHAAVVVRGESGIDRLVAFVVPQPESIVAASTLREELKRRLPAYMIPERFETVAGLPRLISGKTDRKALKALPLAEAVFALEADEVPQTPTEALLLQSAKRVLPGRAIGFDADFFLDLGGHSLIAAQFISIIRETPAFSGITLQNIYQLRSLRAIGAMLDEKFGGTFVARDLSFEPPPLLRRFLCGLAQAVALPFILGLVTVQWLGLFLVSVALIRAESTVLQDMVVFCLTYVVINLAVKLIIIALKWLILGRTKPGRYPLWGVYYFRVWFVSRLIQATTPKFLQMSPLMRVWMRALGAKVGRDSIISEFEAGAWDLIEIGQRVSTGSKLKIANVEFTGNEMLIGPVSIGDHAYVGNSCVICAGARLEDGAEIADLTCVAPDQVIPAWEKWDGSPARKVGMVDRHARPLHPEVPRWQRAVLGTGYFLSYTLLLMIGLVPIFPAFYILYNLDAFFDGALDYEVPWSILPFYALPTAAALIIVSMVIIIALRWMIFPRRVETGDYSIYSFYYFRKWTLALGTEVVLETLNSLFATVFMRYWYSAMGTKIGKGSEISTNLAGRYDLVSIGSGNFIGDEAIFGDEEVRDGFMTLGTVTTGDRVFIGNSAIVSAGATLENDSLVGVYSKLPASLHAKSGETWFGSPALTLPNRQKVEAMAGQTYQPPLSMRMGRTLFEMVHTALPTALFITLGYITADIIEEPITDGNYAASLAIFLAAGVMISLALVGVAVAFKWLLMGVYRPTMKPMWSWWAMRTEACSVLYGGLVGKTSLEFLRGTPFLPWFLRLWGTKIGKGVLLDWTDITEFDCVKIGDYSIINAHSSPQTHLYEDRVMKVGRIEIGRGVTVGSGVYILYDTKIGDYARLMPLTLVMKGENIPAHTVWHGLPAVPVAA